MRNAILWRIGQWRAGTLAIIMLAIVTSRIVMPLVGSALTVTAMGMGRAL
jgi:hypothetical protein